LKVLDLSTQVAAAWCARLCGDYGADVVMREPHPLRKVGPFDADGRSVLAANVLANRRALASAANDTDWAALFAAADVVIDDALADTDERRWIDGYTAGNERLVRVTVTPHGLNGARANRPGNDLSAGARSGWASANGLQGRPPLKQSGYQASYQAGMLAFGALVSALAYRRKSGLGQLIDVSVDDVSVASFAPGILRGLYNRAAVQRRAEIDVTTGPVPVADGYFALTITRPHFWQGAARLLGLDDLAADERLQSTASRNAHKDVFVARMQAAMKTWRKAHLFDELSRIPVVAGPVFTMAELATNAQLAARRYFAEIDGIAYAGAPFHMSETPFRLRRRMPDDAGDNTAIRADWTAAGSEPETATPVPAAPDGPLSGYRGVVLTQAWSGTFATELAALMGAEVIQVEARSRYDSWRGGGYAAPLAAGFADRPTARNSWNCDCRFNSVNLNKQSITLELDTEEGKALFARLVEKADFVAENFSPRVMAKLGLDFAALREIKRDIIYCSISGYGHSGPWSPLPAIGGTIEPTSGMSGVNGYAGERPLNSGQMYPDAVAGLCGFAGIALALYHRDRTGIGQHVDVSMQEANLSFIGERWLEYAMTNVVPGPRGNRHAHFAPHGIYPADGSDRWLAIATETEAQWRTLCDIAGKPGWQTEFGDRAARKADEDALDAAIAEWSVGQDRDDLAERLSAAGVIAAPVLDGLEVVDDPVFRARGAVAETDHPEAGRWWQPAVPCLLSRTPARLRAAAPVKGAHSAAVLERLLGIGRAEYEAFEAAGVTGVTPPKG
jgi:crotonobetainyl-CoA:carnitine CoA-transferase CaiB-like acyl-CoA transferase